MGMYLMRQIGTRGVYANPILPDFMVFLNWTTAVFWYGFKYSLRGGVMVLWRRAARVRVRLVRVPQPRHRRLFVDHHPGAHLRADAGFFRNNFGFGGNNGLTDFKDIWASMCRRPARAPRCLPSPVWCWRRRCCCAGASSIRNSARCWSPSATPNRARAFSATGRVL